jgi:hypothetical protein
MHASRVKAVSPEVFAASVQSAGAHAPTPTGAHAPPPPVTHNLLNSLQDLPIGQLIRKPLNCGIRD